MTDTGFDSSISNSSSSGSAISNSIMQQMISNNMGGSGENTIVNLEQFDSLRVSWEEDVLDQYETESDLSEQLSYEHDQSTQRLFHTFQTSACALAQLFKEKSCSSSSAAAVYDAFQKAAASVTKYHKDSLEACKLQHDIGVAIGQQRKVKELIAWLRKKKRRNIRKDEFINVLIGNNMSGGKQQPTGGVGGTFSTQRQQQPLNKQFSGHRGQQQQQPSMFATAPLFTSASSATTNVFNAIDEINPDLATFREALIMNKRSRDGTLIYHNNSNNSTTTHTFLNTNENQLPNLCTNPNTSQTTNTTSSNTNSPLPLPQSSLLTSQDDLDCFFCEQIATHVDQKRNNLNTSFTNSSNQMCVDMDSPTRKRTRFY